jgi:type II secretory pathway pseudopilin PulG
MKLALNIIGVAMIIAVLAAIVIPTVPYCGPSKETTFTQVQMSQATTALYIYHQEYGQLPAETDNAMLVQIFEGDNPKRLKFYTLDRKKSKTGQFLDGWGKPLIFKPNDTGLLVRSAGKDSIYYTEDDMTQEVQVRARSTSVVLE